MKENEVILKVTLSDLRRFLYEYRESIEKTLDNTPPDKLCVYNRAGVPAVDKACIHNEVIRKAPLPKEFETLHRFLI